MDGQLVDAAVRALRAFDDDLDRVGAGRMLTMWRRFGQMTDREVTAVLARFAEPPSPDSEPGPGAAR